MSPSSKEVAAQLLQDAELGAQFDNLVLSCADKVPLIEEGNYDAIVLSCRKERRFKRDLLAFKFRVVSQGCAFGTVLPGYCNLDFCRGRQLPARSKLAVWLRRINAFAPEVSTKRIHLSIFGKFQFVVRVSTSRGTEDHPLPMDECYSTVVEVLDVVGRISGRGVGA